MRSTEDEQQPVPVDEKVVDQHNAPGPMPETVSIEKEEKTYIDGSVHNMQVHMEDEEDSPIEEVRAIVPKYVGESTLYFAGKEAESSGVFKAPTTPHCRCIRSACFSSA